MYYLRFKRWREPYVFLGAADYHQEFGWMLVKKFEDAAKFQQVEIIRSAIEEINQIEIPKKLYDFNSRTLFLIQLYGKEWDDSVEGMVLDMNDVIKAQILNDKQEVIETIRMRNPVWEKHYA